MSALLSAVLAGLATAAAVGPAPGPLRLAKALPPAPSEMFRLGGRSIRRSRLRLRLRRGTRSGVAEPVGGTGRSGTAGRAGIARGFGRTRAFGGKPVVGGLAPVSACVLAGFGVALLLGGAVGMVLGLATALGGPRLLARLEPRAEREARERLAQDLPLALDLLAACLAGGASLPHAVHVVAQAVPGPCGERLARVGAALDVGTPPAEAWSRLAAATDSGQAASAGRALARAGEGGAPVGAAVARLADDARADQRSRGEQAAERAGVLAVGPLGLCFLPAFVLLGVVPVVAGLVGPLLSGL